MICDLNNHSEILEDTSARPWQKHARAGPSEKHVEQRSPLHQNVPYCVKILCINVCNLCPPPYN